MITRLQLQTESFFKTSHKLRNEALDVHGRAGAERTLRATAVTGVSAKVRLRAIDALKRNGFMAPLTVIGGRDGAA